MGCVYSINGSDLYLSPASNTSPLPTAFPPCNQPSRWIDKGTYVLLDTKYSFKKLSGNCIKHVLGYDNYITWDPNHFCGLPTMRLMAKTLCLYDEYRWLLIKVRREEKMPHSMQASLCCGSKHYPNLKGQEKASFPFQHILICVTRNVGEKKRALSHSSNYALGLEVTHVTSIRIFLTRTNHGGPTTSHPMTRGPGSKILPRAWKSKSQKDLENSTSDHQERRKERRRI